MTTTHLFMQYPKEFLCYAKFKRKADLLLSTLDSFDVIYLDDPNHYIRDYFEADQRAIAVSQVVSCETATHAIVFDDGKEYPELVEKLKNQGCKLRQIKISITRVVNIKRDKQYQGMKSTPSYEYIGRGSDWGNPYSLYDFGGNDEASSREEVVHKYNYDFGRGYLKKNKQDALVLAGKTLGCFCKPEACHGDVLAEYLNSIDDGL